MLNLINKTLGLFIKSKSQKDLEEISPYVGKINAVFAQLAHLSDDELRAKTQEVETQIADHLINIDQQIKELKEQAAALKPSQLNEKEEIFEQVDKLEETRNEELENVLMEVLPTAFAIVKDTARRLSENKQLSVIASDKDLEFAQTRDYITIDGGNAIWSNKWTAAGTEVEWNMVHYDVQLIGGIVLHKGMISEMATGEGKTLVATLPAFLNALARRGVHVVTVNDYLAKRDSEWMAPIFEFHGITIDCIDKYQSHSPQRIAAYQADITYGTNNEFGFDYLRDNMAHDGSEQVQRKHHYAMVDEVDSVLIDDARTPLIISGPVPRGDEHEFHVLKPRIEKLVEAQKKLVQGYINEAKKAFAGDREEDGGHALFRAYRGLPKSKPLIKLLSEQGMKQRLHKIEGHYLADNAKEMPKADAPLYFVIDEKHNTIDLTTKGIELITGEGEDKDFFILPDISITLNAVDKDSTLDDKTKLEKKDTIIQDYTIKTQRIHTVNQILKAYTLFVKDTDYIIQEDKVMIVDEQTGRVMEGRRYSDGLHQALEAKENVKVENATQTYATVTLQNYFRMYHKLSGMTGTAETEAAEFYEIYKLDVVNIPTNRPITRDDRQDFVFRTVREKYNAVADEIQKLVGEGRPILVGTTSVENSEILSRMLKMKKIEHQVLNAKQHAREADVVARAGENGMVTIATNMAGRGTDIKLSEEVKGNGGLAIIGTERHESRRVDRQLRGRSGRQGDTGSSQFFVSLEDNLMRLFGSDRIAKVMDRLGHEDGEVIQHSMISKSIERAQRKVEENNFSSRKRLLEYDDVMNSQREVIYRRRSNALKGERLSLDIMNNFYDVAFDLVTGYKESFEDFKLNALRIFGIDTSIDAVKLAKGKEDDLAFQLFEEAQQHYAEKNQAIIDQALPVIQRVKTEKGDAVRQIVVPLTDGGKSIQLPVDINEILDSEGDALVKALEKAITMAVIDQGWKDHLREMDELKQQVQNAVFEQKDPLLIYKFEAFQLFKGFIAEINEDTVSFLAKAKIPVNDESEVQNAPAPQSQKQQRVSTSKAEAQSSIADDRTVQAAKAAALAAGQKQAEVTKPRHSAKQYGRNDVVTVKYSDGTMKADVKYKKVEQDVLNNKCMVIE